MTEASPDAPSPAPESRWSGFLSPFQHTTYRQTWLANLGVFFGGMIQMTGASWMMTTLTSDPLPIALVQASVTLPVMLFSVLSGAVADNFHRRTVMMVANALTFTLSLALLITTLCGVMTPWWLLTFTFLVGCGVALNGPAWQASVGDLVPRKDLPAAVTLNSVCFNLSRSLAPALGGLIIAMLGVVATFAVNAISYLGLIGVLSRWPEVQARSTLPRERLGRSVFLGLRYAAMSPDLARIMLRGFVFGLSAIAILALLPLVARELVGGGPRTYGLMLGAVGVGGLIGAALNNRIRSTFSNEWIIRIACLLSSVGAGLLAFSTHLWISCTGLLMAGTAWVMALSLMNVSVQLSSPRWVVGRTLAIYQTATFGGFAAGSWLWGSIAEVYTVPVALMGSSTMLIVCALLGLKVAIPDPLNADLSPSGHWREPELEMKIQPNSGPIIVEAEYRIREADVSEFLDRMEDRRRARIRDGAHHWTLSRDLHEPEIWRVSFQFPTWLEYVRHNTRITEYDAIHGHRVRDLHQGDEPPKIRRFIERETIMHPPVRIES